MKVLWFTNTSSCYKPIGNGEVSSKYNGGGWISSAENVIVNKGDVELAVSFFLNNQPAKIKQNSVVYYPIPRPQYNIWSRMRRKIMVIGEGCRCHHVEENTWNYYLEHFQRVVEDFQPDVIHVWGSEEAFGLVWKVTNIPVILHIQGIITPYWNAFLPPFISWNDYFIKSNNPIKHFLDKMPKKEWCDLVYREQEIYKGLTLVMGRTGWDERVSHILNPYVPYLHVDEILRKEFYESDKRSLPSKLTIVTTISSPLYKGFDLVLKTAKLLKYNLNINFDWLCYGNINPKFIEKVIGINHNDVNVKLMGVASSIQLRESELNATLYFHSSYIDNSPNSLCEAQMLGLPVVSTNVGGIPSLVTHGEDGFLAPANDPFQCACYIEKLYKDQNLNTSMGINGHEKAAIRHNEDRIIKQIICSYFSVLSNN